MEEKNYNHLSSEFLKKLKMKLWYLYWNDYEIEILEYNEQLIKKIEESPDAYRFSSFIKRICKNLTTAIQFKHNDNNVMWADRKPNIRSDALQELIDNLKTHISYYSIIIKPYKDNHERFNLIIKYNIKALIALLKIEEGFLITHDCLIKFLCQILYEITEWKTTFTNRTEYDELLKTYSITLLLVLHEIDRKLKEKVLHIAPKLKMKKQMHRKLINSVVKYSEEVRRLTI